MDYQKICKTENLDENKIFEIITRRRCDYIRKPPKISAEINGETVFFGFLQSKIGKTLRSAGTFPVSHEPKANMITPYVILKRF